jgi:hypothetical protein
MNCYGLIPTVPTVQFLSVHNYKVFSNKFQPAKKDFLRCVFSTSVTGSDKTTAFKMIIGQMKIGIDVSAGEF